VNGETGSAPGHDKGMGNDLGRWQVVRGQAPPGALEAVARCAAGHVPGDAETLRRGNTRLSVRLPGLGVAKILRRVGLREKVLSVTGPSILAAEFDLTELAARRGVPAPRPVFCAERRWLGVLRAAAIVFDTVPAVALESLIHARFPRPGVRPRPGGDVRRALARAGRTLGRLHQAGGVHGDPSPDNWLVRAGPTAAVTLIDWPSAVFAGHRNKRLRQAAERCHITPAALNAALSGYEAEGPRSAGFLELCLDDVRKMVSALIRLGTPLREILAALNGYCQATGTERAGRRRLIARVAEGLAARLPGSLRRTLRNADRDSRATGAVREGGAVLCYGRSVPPGEVRAAFDGPSHFESVARANAADCWRNACALARMHLPARLAVGCRFDPSTGRGVLLVEKPDAAFEAPGEGDAPRLGRFVRLLHAFGFRFAACARGTIRKQPGAFGPFTFRQGSGLVLDDLGAVQFAPEAPFGQSLDAVETYVEENWGEAAAAAFREHAARPLRFRL